jgi:hypothetical protein
MSLCLGELTFQNWQSAESQWKCNREHIFIFLCKKCKHGANVT